MLKLIFWFFTSKLLFVERKLYNLFYSKSTAQHYLQISVIFLAKDGFFCGRMIYLQIHESTPFRHLWNCENAVHIGDGSLMKTSDYQIEQHLENMASEEELTIGVFQNIFKPILQHKAKHCHVGKSPFYFQQIAVFF